MANSWARRVTVKRYGDSAVSMLRWSNFNTVEDVAHIEIESPINTSGAFEGFPTSGHRYSFHVNTGIGNLFQRCVTVGSRHSFVTGYSPCLGVVVGPHVWLDCIALGVQQRRLLELLQQLGGRTFLRGVPAAVRNARALHHRNSRACGGAPAGHDADGTGDLLWLRMQSVWWTRLRFGAEQLVPVLRRNHRGLGDLVQRKFRALYRRLSSGSGIGAGDER